MSDDREADAKRRSLAGPLSLVALGFLLVAFWFVAFLPALATPLGYPPGTALRRFLFGNLWPLVGSALVITGGLFGGRRCRVAGGWRVTAGAALCWLAAAAGGVAFLFFIYLM